VRSGLCDNLYNDDSNGIANQIDEAQDLAALLGWRGIFARVDVGWLEWARRTIEQRRALFDGITSLLGALTPVRPGFGYKLGISSALDLSPDKVHRLVRGRAVVDTWTWNDAQLRELVVRYVLAAGGPDPRAWLADPLWELLRRDLVAIWGLPGPAAAVTLAHELLQRDEQPAPGPLLELRKQLYARTALLLLDPDPVRRTIWRGRVPIILDETPYRFFERLWRSRGSPVANESLQEIAGSQANLDQYISRLRKKLEPFLKQNSYTMYIKRQPGLGTQLEHYGGT